MPIHKLCSFRGCTKIIDNDVMYCEYHQAKWEQKEKERYKEYSKRRKINKEQKKYQDFYASDAWQRIRSIVINDCYGIDILEYYKTGKIIQGECIHHIDTIEDNWNSKLDFGNLIYLTERNHRQVHSKYNEGQREKKQIQRILYGLLDKWNEDYGLD
jgi:hypothetical protein